ncbi:MAG: hypothetical protein J0G33_02940 [Afipia felis]|uniref:Uncharacterized protein n=2 Tax=Afipia felis TaxID=1035 RepID=A0A380W787_AFIFE|nr:hypothetical protein [Afipia felis]EKS27546.1 hypothetical protein HMPREF9697_00074 [Afipia felis ATCC 53690]MBN9601867.1 hypothetical protein [Afipia felis]SUU76256.1 Uncharacterised protein [Afipia felis]SUU84323.1 Uncharacterised protein [Afipia felis]
MADIYSIISSNYVTVGNNISGLANSSTPYVPVDASLYQGSWTGAYADNTKFTIQISNVTGFRAKVRYQSGSTLKYQDILIKDNSFKFGDSKFTLTQTGKAQVKTVMTNAATGAQSLETAYATMD